MSFTFGGFGSGTNIFGRVNSSQKPEGKASVSYEFSDEALMKMLLGVSVNEASVKAIDVVELPPGPLTLREEQAKDACDLKIVGPDGKKWLLWLPRARVYSTYFGTAEAFPVDVEAAVNRVVDSFLDRHPMIIDAFVGFLWRGSYSFDNASRLTFMETQGVATEPANNLAQFSEIVFHWMCFEFSLDDGVGCKSFGCAALQSLREALKQPIDIKTFVTLVTKVFHSGHVKVPDPCAQIKKIVATHGAYYHENYISHEHAAKYHSVFQAPGYGLAYGQASSDLFTMKKNMNVGNNPQSFASKNSAVSNNAVTDKVIASTGFGFGSGPSLFGTAPLGSTSGKPAAAANITSASTQFGVGPRPFGIFGDIPAYDFKAIAKNTPPPPPNFGTAGTPFTAFEEKDTSGRQRYQTIIFQQPYQRHSLEELRLADYGHGRRFGQSVSIGGVFLAGGRLQF